MDDNEDDKVLVDKSLVTSEIVYRIEKSGYDLKNGDREGLKQHLKETCTMGWMIC